MDQPVTITGKYLSIVRTTADVVKIYSAVAKKWTVTIIKLLLSSLVDSNAIGLPESYAPPVSPGYSYEYDADRRATRVVFPSAQDDPDGLSAPDNRIIENVFVGALLEETLTPEGAIDYVYECNGKLDYVEKYDDVSQNVEKIDSVSDGRLVKSMSLSG